MILRTGLTLAVGIAVGLLSYHYSLNIIDGSRDQQISVLGTIAQISVSMMGFMLAALAILASISDKPLIKNMANLGLFKDLLLSLFTACSIYMLSFLISASVLVLGDYGVHWKNILLGAVCSSIVATAQIGWKFWKVLSNLNI